VLFRIIGFVVIINKTNAIKCFEVMQLIEGFFVCQPGVTENGRIAHDLAVDFITGIAFVLNVSRSCTRHGDKTSFNGFVEAVIEDSGQGKRLIDAVLGSHIHVNPVFFCAIQRTEQYLNRVANTQYIDIGVIGCYDPFIGKAVRTDKG